jgi:hypothetical protein
VIGQQPPFGSDIGRRYRGIGLVSKSGLSASYPFRRQGRRHSQSQQTTPMEIPRIFALPTAAADRRGVLMIVVSALVDRF